MRREMRIFAHKQTENRQRTDNQTNTQRTENSKTEATLILCGSSGERANCRIQEPMTITNPEQEVPNSPGAEGEL